MSMHTNAFYLRDSTVLDKDVKNNPLYNVSHASTAPLLARLVPHVNGHVSHSGPASLSDYEIPLDKNWEFPREWYVDQSQKEFC